MRIRIGGVAGVLLMTWCAVASAAEGGAPGAPFRGAGCPATPAASTVSASFTQSSSSASTGTRLRPVAQVSRSEKADVTFELRPSSGGVELVATTPGLQISKVVQGNGESRLQLKTDTETITVAMNGRGTSVGKGGRHLELPRGTDAPRNRAEIRRVLADSDAVLRYRAVADALMAADDRSPAALGIIITDAMVGVLGGDIGAPRRVAEFLAHNRSRNLRPVGMAIDCFTLMEQRMVEAWIDYTSCYLSVSGSAFAMFMQETCAGRWVVQVESYWFNFISCTGFSF